MHRLTLVAVVAWALPAHADDVLHVGTPSLDPPTLVALGVSLPITGDDNFTATVTVRYRAMGSATWRDGLPLQHVHAEVVSGLTVSPQFAGSIFDLRPDTSYELELHAVDADGGIDTTLQLVGRTRAVPHDPATPHPVAVASASALTTALSAAQPGDVITLAPGTYTGNFAIRTSGTAADPIVIRGDNAVLDGNGCNGCNVLEVYGSFTHVEQITIQNGTRALRYQGAGTEANVLRRVHIRNVVLGIGSQPDQRDYYIADNTLEGRLVWPCTYISDDTACNAGSQHGLHANDDGIQVQGTGHVIAHNTISGFGDAMKTEQTGAISIDFYGNDVLWTYDNGIELDGSARNTRAFRNRLTNTYATLSFQPIYGGPGYAIRNVIVNVADEQFKLHSLGGTPTVGAVIYHNTVVRAQRAVVVSAGFSPRYFTLANNLFLGPSTIADGFVVRWDVPDVATAAIDYNGYFPDGKLEFGYGAGGTTYTNLAAAIAGGRFDTHSLVVSAGTLASGLVGPADYQAQLMPMLAELAVGSPAIDRGVRLPNLNDDAPGAAPDLGALELGCAAPTYGVRPVGVDEATQDFSCTPQMPGGDDVVGGDAGTGGGDGKASGCGCRSGDSSGVLIVLALCLPVLRRRRQA